MRTRKLILFGSTGFIGSHLLQSLKEYEIKTISSAVLYNIPPEELAREFEQYDIVINLAGSTIFTLWTKRAKKKMIRSRILTTRKIVDALALCEHRPSKLLNASAVGIYQADRRVDENSEAFADNFLSGLIRDWEHEARKVEAYGVSLTLMRFGIVLGKEGGAYRIMRALTKFNLGGYFGKGDQSFPFIYIQDLLKAIKFSIEKDIAGVINYSAPELTDFMHFATLLKKSLHSILLWPLPRVLIKTILGEASVLFLEGQNVVPGVLTENSFNFEASTIEQCIQLIEAP